MSTRNTAPQLSARRTQTRQRLMEAAVQVFAEKGIAGATVEELSEAAGFTRGAFYSNFDSKDELCFALMRSVAASALAAVETALAGIESRRADTVSLSDTAVDTFLRAQSSDRASVLLLMEMQLYAMRHPDFARAYQAVQDETHALFVRAIDEVLERRNLQFALPSDQVVQILHAVHQTAQAEALRNPGQPSPLAPQLKALLSALLR